MTCLGPRAGKGLNKMKGKKVDVLILGKGWSSDFLIPLLQTGDIYAPHGNKSSLEWAATTRDGRDGTIKFQFDPEARDKDQIRFFEALPDASTVVIVFPIYAKGGSETLVNLYTASRAGHYSDDEKNEEYGSETLFLQLGSTGIWDGGPTLSDSAVDHWVDRHSAYNMSNDRANAESELLSLHGSTRNSVKVRTCVLNLAGLWGGSRSIIRYVQRLAPTKEALAKKTNVHMVHGLDVGRAILAIHRQTSRAAGQRWLLTDLKSYDWWDLVLTWGESGAEKDKNGDFLPAKGMQGTWVRELMVEQKVRALPRSAEQFQRSLDSREFWDTFDLAPVKARLG